VTETFRRYVDVNARLIAEDLTALLNRAYRLGIAICPDIDHEEGISYSVEWAFDGESKHLDVEWGTEDLKWEVG
jgi:hypothetical protein